MKSTPPKHVLMLSPDCYMIDRRILQEARSLLGQGYRVTLLSGFESPREEHYVQDGIEIHRYQYDWDDERIKQLRPRIGNRRLQLLFHKAFMAAARRWFRFNSFDVFVLSIARQFQADIVHVHDLPLLKHGAKLAEIWKVPLVFDAHEIYYEQEVLSPKVRKRLRLEEKRYAPKAHLFITVNENLAECFRQSHGDLPLLVLMNCAEEYTQYDRQASRRLLLEKSGLSGDPFIVLYQGWISAERNLTTLVGAVRHFPEDTVLVIMGYGEHQSELEEIASSNGSQGRVRFLGRIEPDDVLRLTSGADLGVIPYLPTDLNHRFCSPNKFFEYVQARVPTLAHELIFFQRMRKQHGVVATADLSSIESMAESVRRLRHDPAELEKMRRACQAAARTLSWQTESEKLLNAYSKLL